MIVKRTFLATAALCALSLVLLAWPANAQSVIDGFAGNAIVDASGFFVTDAGGNTVYSPAALGGTYTLHLATDATVMFADGSTATVTQVAGFYEIFTVPAGNNNDNPGTDPRGSLGGTAASLPWHLDTVTDTAKQAWGWTDGEQGGTGKAKFDPGSGQLLAGGTAGANNTVGTENKLGTFTWSTGTNPLAGQTVYFGFDVMVANGTLPNGSPTGKVYFWTNPGDGFVPEPAFYQMAGFLSLGGLGLLKLRRRRK